MGVKTRFQAGDIIEVRKYWDVINDQWCEGVIMIDLVYDDGVYELRCLKGNLNWIQYNFKFLDQEPYLVWLGNINEDPALKLLFGGKD